MNFARRMLGGLLAALLLVTLTACRGAPVTFAEIPIPPQVTPLARGENPLADTIGATLEDALRERGTVEMQLYAVPATFSWEQIAAFYADEMAGTDWRAAAELTQDTEAFKTAGYLRGSFASEQGLAVGYAPDLLGKGAFLMVALFSE